MFALADNLGNFLRSLVLPNMMGLRVNTELVMGGAFSDSSGALVLLEVDGIEKARELISRDPAILEKILTAEVYEWDRVV